MSAPKARVIAHKIRQSDQRIGIVVLYSCPLCGDEHGAGWHSPTSEGGERVAPCTVNPATGLGAYVALHWPGIPGSVSAALIEWRPDILGRSDLSDTPDSNEGGPSWPVK